MATDSKTVPTEWEPRLAGDLAELVEAAADLNRLVAVGETPEAFELALIELAPGRPKA